MFNTKKLKFAIGIPTINRFDLLSVALDRYAKTYPNAEIFIIDNGNQRAFSPHPHTQIYVATHNYGVAKSWNYLCKEIFKAGYSHALILNDDIVINANQELVNEFIGVQFPDSDFAYSALGWCAFIISKETFEAVGDFDEKFGNAYFEDNDYTYRMKLLGMKQLPHEALNPIQYVGSQSIAKDPSLNSGFNNNREYYLKKWGGLPTTEAFTKPFNEGVVGV